MWSFLCFFFQITNCKGSSELHDIQLNQVSPSQFSVLVPPTAVFEFDWSGKSKIPTEQTTKRAVEGITSGSAQVIFMWWDLKMDQDGEILLSCAPHWAHPDYESLTESNTLAIPHQNVIPWRDHWMQAVYYLPQARHIQKDDKLTLHSFHDEFSLWFDLKSDVEDDEDMAVLLSKRPLCECGFHLAYSRTRIGQLNDNLRNKTFMKTLENNIDTDSTVLFLSDGSLVGLVIAALNAKHVYYLEPNRYSSQVIQKYIAFNELTNVELISNLEAESISNWDEITHVIGEPSFITSILPWDNFYFSVLIKQIRSRLNENVKVIPCEASIHAIPVEFIDLQKICSPFEECETFDLSIFDQLLEVSSIYQLYYTF